VAIFACAFFTAFTGASGVTILALGGLLFPMLCRVGYPERFNLGLLTSSGSLGLLFPPSLAVLMYGIVAGVSIDQLFLAGLVPGALLMLMLMVYTMLSGAHRHIPREPFSAARLAGALREGAWDLALPVGLVAGIFSGIVTVTEAAACTAAYVILIECVVHRDLGLARDMPRVLRDTAALVGSILVILGAAMGLTNQLIDAQVPMRLLGWMGDHVHSQIGFLLLLNALLLLVGAMMDIFSAIVVVVPLILPLAEQFGVDPVHLGIVLLANLEIGYSTPPVGINLFIASHRFGRPVLTLFRATLPFLAVMIAWLLVITWFPQVSLWWR
jgi:tripartite ATP-independent transporter DctM subunit